MDPCYQTLDLQFAIAAQTTASPAFLTGPGTYCLMFYYDEDTVVAMRNEGAKMREQELQAEDVEDTCSSQ